MSQTVGNDLPVGDIQFYDNYLPSLDAGLYRITVQPSIDGIDTQGFFQTIVQEFEVQGPQFVLDPNDIHGMNPPTNASGQYSEILPHIVLNQLVLPWERQLVTGEKSTPWMALLLFEQSELISVKNKDGVDSTLITSTVQELLAASVDTLKPNLDPTTLSPSDLSTQCNSILISTDTFTAITPRQEELPYLAHCRQLNTGDRAMDEENDDGWFSVVMSNRFPSSGTAGSTEGTTNVAHLVSLEGFAPYLVDKPSFPPGKNKVQIVSLASWSFVSMPVPGESFADLAQNLVLPEGDDPSNLMLKLPVSDSKVNPVAVNRLNDGYAALSYHTFTGEDTFAWYRGPFTPVMPQPLPDNQLLTTASAATIYDATNGIFDLSYAAAWQIGRSLALADPAFSAALTTMRRRVGRMVKQMQHRSTSTLLASAPPMDFSQLLESQVFAGQFDSMVKNGLADKLTSLFNAHIPVPPEPQPAPVQAENGRSVSAKQAHQEFVSRPEVQSFVLDAVDPHTTSAANWIAKVSLLNNVPFNHLVPDSRMLPAESIRFFYIDTNWLNALADGALSVGLQSSRDVLYHSILHSSIKQKALSTAQNLRSQLTGFSYAESSSDDDTITGFLIRSALVAGWPGLVIRAYSGGQQVQPLRMQQLSSTVLLCLFQGVPETLTLSEPQQGLRFGVEDDGLITIRSITDPVGKPTGKNIQIGGSSNMFMRQSGGATGKRVLNIYASTTGQADIPVGTVPSQSGTLVRGLADAIGVGSIGPADFGIQMVKAPQQLLFDKQ